MKSSTECFSKGSILYLYAFNYQDILRKELCPSRLIYHQKENIVMAMTVEIKENKLCIEIELEKPYPSSSGKTLVVASTRGNIHHR
jgi:hypothetical protein